MEEPQNASHISIKQKMQVSQRNNCLVWKNMYLCDWIVSRGTVSFVLLGFDQWDEHAADGDPSSQPGIELLHRRGAWKGLSGGGWSWEAAAYSQWVMVTDRSLDQCLIVFELMACSFSSWEEGGSESWARSAKGRGTSNSEEKFLQSPRRHGRSCLQGLHHPARAQITS